MIVTATEVTLYTDISASAGTITSSGLIPIVQDRVNSITHNYFDSDIYIGGTITAGSDWDVEGFIAGDEIYVYGSFRNDGYFVVGSVTTTTLTVSSADTIINEPSGRSILVSVVQWPDALKYIAAQLVKYDYDDRGSRSIGVASETLGPYSVSYASQSHVSTPYGYPQELIDGLSAYTRMRVK
jgi:hypothetical protein